MKLKDQFAKATGNGTYYVIPIVEDAEIIEKIADEFAIGFADWFHENCYEDQIGYYTASELLETYKRQKGL